jgi:hypothetical protein
MYLQDATSVLDMIQLPNDFFFFDDTTLNADGPSIFK